MSATNSQKFCRSFVAKCAAIYRVTPKGEGFCRKSALNHARFCAKTSHLPFSGNAGATRDRQQQVSRGPAHERARCGNAAAVCSR